MAIDTRNCFWFGTEERSSWFATPLQGADSSPSAWGADGTLLNGGGWALNSWGSHKRYTYEWPASSSRETAQKMKSYRDGTYGRGLLYFLEPTIFTTNVLPAHWADPSMSLDNEAPSLVYGVDPVAVQTSGGANLGLPVTSAQYDLSSVTPQTLPTPDSSVFIPIPTGHTLFLGAFYSSTGTGGVFATPVNGNGTLGTAVKLTEKPNSDTDVVTDPFSGDLRGVRLWVGRSDSSASSVTIAAMAGRLIETSVLPVYGPWVEQRRNVCTNPSFETQVTPWTGSSIARSTEWADTGSYSGRAVLSGSQFSGDTRAGSTTSFAFGTQPGGTYFVTAVVNLPEHEDFNPSGDSRQRRLVMWNVSASNVPTPQFGPQVPNTAGVHVLTGTITLDADAAGSIIGIGMAGSTLDAGKPAFVDSIYISEIPGSYFDGSTDPSGDLERTLWSGTPNSSESILEVRTRTGNAAKEAQLKGGPWIGGQGHSGCRFLGTPTYVTNSPIEGGRIGFAATFVEVGSWVYG